MNTLPCVNLVVVTAESLCKVFCVELFEFCSCPSGEVNTVGYITDVQLVGEVAGPHIAEQLFAHLAVQPAHTINLLRKVASQYTHRELLVGVVGVGLTEVDELLPSDAQTVGEVRHILANHALGERIVTCGNRGVGCEQRRRTDNLQSLAEREVFGCNQLADTLDADECSVALVAVVNLLFDTYGTECADTTDTEQQLLFQTVLPVAAVEVVSDAAIVLAVELVVGVEQVEVGTSYLALPDTGGNHTAGHCNLNAYPRAIGVTNGRDGEFVEVLCLVGCLLLSEVREFLSEVTVAVQKTYCNHLHILVTGLFDVVTCEDTQTTRVDFERRVQTVLHAEISDFGSHSIFLLGHVGLEVSPNSVHLCEELVVALQLFQTVVAQTVEELDGVVVACSPQLGVDTFEELVAIESPAPPQVFRQSLQRAKTLGKVLLDHHAGPVGGVC